jgi:hypothetical protein
MPVLTASLRALLTHLIDYAGLYPPAGLPIADVARKYESYAASRDGWILNRLVLPSAHLGIVKPSWHVSLLVDQDPGPLPPAIETFETKQPGRFSLPAYCELPLENIPAGEGFAKIRTGGLTPDAIPTTEALARFIFDAASRPIAFKATAGLHHPIRSERALTYAADSPRAVMHGFLNVFAAAAFAWNGADFRQLTGILAETDPNAFDFLNAELRWRGNVIYTPQIAAARRDFAHSFGSCSFEEPVSDLRRLGLLP